MSFNLSAGQKLHFVGDSLTAFGWPFAGLTDALQYGGSPGTHYFGSRGPGSVDATLAGGAVAGTVGLMRSLAPPLTITSVGTSGDTISGLVSNFATRVTAFNPDLLVIEYGTNDANLLTSTGAFTTSYNTVLNNCAALNPAMKVLCISIMAKGWSFTAGTPPSWNNGSFDTDVDTYNTLIQASVAGHSSFAEYVDVRTPALNYLNAGSVGGKINLDNALHPAGAGQRVMCTAARSHITIV